MKYFEGTQEEYLKAAANYKKKNNSLAGFTKKVGFFKNSKGGTSKVRVKEGGRLSLADIKSYSGYQSKRRAAEKAKTEEEARYLAELKKQAKAQSKSTEAQFVSSGKAAIAEHDVRLASGGSNEYMSISDPEFKVWKDAIEAKAASKFGDKVVVDVDDVSGDVRVIPASIHNKFQPTSVQLGIDIPIDFSIDDSFKQVNNLLEQPLSKLVKPLQELDFSGGKARFKSAGSVLPFVGVAAGVLGAGEAFAAGDPREGVARLLETGAGEVPVVGDVVQPEGVAGGTFEDVQRRTAEGLRARELQQRAAEARQRGGKLSFGVGGVKFKLPEFGLSELMGIN
jgi:hypothetical protein